VHPPVGDPLGPRGEQVVERIQRLDAVVDSLGQERLPDIPVQPLLLSPAFWLTGQSWLILWITRRWMTGLLSGFVAGAFEAAELFFVVADLGGDGFEAAAQLVDLHDQAGQGGGIASAGAVLVDDGAQVGAAVESGAADAGARGDLVECDGLPGRGEFGAGGLDPGLLAGVSWHRPG
jgi:hypothetical protein